MLSEALTFDAIVGKAPPYRLLALDGGGIRGLVTIEVLAQIEALLESALQPGKPLVLADFFDYVAGTSTGAVIATCVSLGMRVEEIRKMYLESADLMFDRASILQRLRYKYDDEPLARKLQEVLSRKTGEAEPSLGSSGLKTLLMMVLRNASTDSPWPLSNNPRAKYNPTPERPDTNLHLPLWQVMRGSTAAPTYFPPEQITIGGKQFVFVDGGITPYNNPAFQLFIMSTAEPYRLGWKTKRPEDMLLVSIGTGTSPYQNGTLAPEDMNLLFNATQIPSALMFASLNEQDLLCRLFGKCLVGDVLDRELGSMVHGKGAHGSGGPVDPKLFTYLRYNAELTRQGLDALGLPDIEPHDVQKLDSTAHKDALRRIGVAVAEQQVRLDHFRGFLGER
ncbi:Patatin-like phospholipase [Paraburkholderia fungorum]|uniref:Patatin-like phospholipase n=1 Tax=Paraburkholderia fungorum TaxID=134537 RepID=A0A1H1JMQ8_9BURK|nr:patatin-like phospholipase family protein [Paraburkholderia fungorum]SDR51298.1 Patatin-like phospholipase [Paraburkholderia fungorum]